MKQHTSKKESPKVKRATDDDDDAQLDPGPHERPLRFTDERARARHSACVAHLRSFGRIPLSTEKIAPICPSQKIGEGEERKTRKEGRKELIANNAPLVI